MKWPKYIVVADDDDAMAPRFWTATDKPFADRYEPPLNRCVYVRYVKGAPRRGRKGKR